MTERIPCSALRGSECHNGFPVTAVCHGISAEHVTPICLKEEVCGGIYAATGGVPLVIQRVSQSAKEPR